MQVIINEKSSLHSLTYMALITIAYYGPNAGLLGNVQLAIWHFERPIDDIGAYVFNVFLFFAVDLLSLVVNAVILWKVCNINLLKKMKKLQHCFWHVFAITEAFLMIEVYKNAILIFQSFAFIHFKIQIGFCPIVHW